MNSQSKLHPALSVFFILLLAGLGFIVGGVVGYYCYLPFYNGTEAELNEAIQDIENHPDLKNVLFTAQVGATIGGLVIAPLIFLRTQMLPVTDYFRHNRLPFFLFFLAGLTVVVSFGLNSMIMKFNQDVVFPDFLKDFENWARVMEEKAAAQTEVLTSMNGLGELIITLVVIAILPAICEEFVFRGLIQNELYRGTRNPHVAIWFAAMLFSAIHFQFFGFLPRMMLGALFGYLYYWSGNLWISIFAHFANNAVQVIALYYYQQGSFEFDLEKPESVPASVGIMSALLTAGLLFYLYRDLRKYKNATQST